MKKIYALLILMMTSTTMFGQLIINEVLYDPSNNGLEGDANGDGAYDQEQDSFIEFYNTSDFNFDATGYEIYDDTVSGGLKFTAPEGTLIPPHGAWVVFGGGVPVGDFGGALVQSDSTSSNGLNLNNSGEVIAIKNAMGHTVLTFDSDALSNNPNESYTRYPDITGDFIQSSDSTPYLFSPGTMVDLTPFNTVYVVSSVTVSSENGMYAIDTQGGTLQMTDSIYPSYAGNTVVDWSVSDENLATIDANGLLTAAADGDVWVKATATDGTGFADSVQVSISNQSSGLFNPQAGTAFNIYPNPASNYIRISGINKIEKVRIYDTMGRLLKEESTTTDKLDVSSLKNGVYFIGVFTGNSWGQKLFVKE